VTPEYTKSGFGFSKLWRATGQEILNVSRDIQETVFKTFGIHIESRG
jgi:hypothetical protein